MCLQSQPTIDLVDPFSSYNHATQIYIYIYIQYKDEIALIVCGWELHCLTWYRLRRHFSALLHQNWTSFLKHTALRVPEVFGACESRSEMH